MEFINLSVYDSFHHGREATDSFTIAASPNFGIYRRASNTGYSHSDIGNGSNIDIDVKAPLLSKSEKYHQKEGLERVSRTQSWWSQKTSLHEQLSGELPIGGGCSFTQTVFNGEQCYYSFQLS